MAAGEEDGWVQEGVKGRGRGGWGQLNCTFSLLAPKKKVEARDGGDDFR